jgi:hypothetical protein
MDTLILCAALGVASALLAVHGWATNRTDPKNKKDKQEGE